MLPFAGLIAGVSLLWGWGFTWLDLGLLVSLYLITAIGITAGFHRLFTHRSFETYAPIRGLLAVLGSMTIQGPVLRWVAWHRRHHHLSDQAGDPHTPHHSGEGISGWIKGFWHSHVGWLFGGDPPELNRYVADLRKSAIIRWVSWLFPLWVVIGLMIPFAVAYLITDSWIAASRAFIWAGLVRIFLVHHVTWSVNSVCHLWGSKTYKSNDESRDNFVFGVLALGEGWHNTHHAFPTSARHGLKWWQPDVSYYLIRALELVGLAWNVRRPSEEALAAARA
jgi:stearoyl-CoA desaturase (delta-9 desaturase)